jgi:hypothetical protein
MAPAYANLFMGKEEKLKEVGKPNIILRCILKILPHRLQ